MNSPDSCKTDTGKPPFKASEGSCFENLRVSEDITPSEFQQGKGTRVPIRPKVRLEAFPNGLPMSVSSKVYAPIKRLRFIIIQAPFEFKALKSAMGGNEHTSRSWRSYAATISWPSASRWEHNPDQIRNTGDQEGLILRVSGISRRLARPTRPHSFLLPRQYWYKARHL